MIISFLNHKGGVGKTTSAINIGAGLAKLGKKVLLIDADPQANLSQSLGYTSDELETLYDNISDAIEGKSDLSVYNRKDKLDVVPSSLDLSAAEIRLLSETGREYFLKGLIEPLKKKYDYILIDCAPSLGVMSLNALSASDKVIIPVQTQVLALNGMKTLLEVIYKVQKRTNPSLDIMGFLLTMVDSRTALNKQVVEDMRKAHGEKVFKGVIRMNITLAETPAAGKDIFDYDSTSNGAADYLAIAKEILKLK